MSAFLIYAVLAAAALAVLIALVRSGRFLTGAFVSVLQGFVSLLGVGALAAFTGVHVAVNPYTLTFCGVFGLPGTIALVLANTIFHL